MVSWNLTTKSTKKWRLPISQSMQEGFLSTMNRGYWDRVKFVGPMKSAIQLAEIKYPKSEGWRPAWVFDHSRCHAALGDDALDVKEMNVKPGGKQCIMNDTIWQGQIQTFAFRDGTAKGMKRIILERGIDTTNMVADQMREMLATHPDVS